jgi:AraC-like DNA-binding protein
MIFHKHIPALPLSQYVDCMVYVEGNNKGTGFPKTAMSLVFNLNDSFKLYSDAGFTSSVDYKKHWVAGLQTGPTYVESYGESKMVVVQFTTTGACAFFNMPLHHFTDQYVPLDCVFNKHADEIWEQLHEAKTINEKMLVTENFLLRNFLQNKITDGRLLTSVDAVFSLKKNLSVDYLCRQHRISRKHLNFLFKEYLGISPKMMASLNRLQNVFQKISQAKSENLTSLAYELDYFDQAHFNNNFKKFTGIRPGDYLKSVSLKPTLKIIPHFLPAD